MLWLQFAREGVAAKVFRDDGAASFCRSEGLPEHEARCMSEDAAYEKRLCDVLERGRADYAAGRVVVGTSSALEEIEREAAART